MWPKWYPAWKTRAHWWPGALLPSLCRPVAWPPAGVCCTTSRLWRRKRATRLRLPGFFVSFPSQKDSTNPAATAKPTAEAVAMIDAAACAPWLALPDAQRPADYYALKVRVKARLLAQFLRHFPKLAPMVRFHDLSTPLTQRRFVRSPEGATYGIKMTAERLINPALHVRTPLSGLLLAGQDVTSPGVPTAFMGGLMAAASL